MSEFFSRKYQTVKLILKNFILVCKRAWKTLKILQVSSKTIATSTHSLDITCKRLVWKIYCKDCIWTLGSWVKVSSQMAVRRLVATWNGIKQKLLVSSILGTKSSYYFVRSSVVNLLILKDFRSYFVVLLCLFLIAFLQKVDNLQTLSV